jgi:enamine deaminase RidA (YjgF/YER057c/UK114 family)
MEGLLFCFAPLLHVDCTAFAEGDERINRTSAISAAQETGTLPSAVKASGVMPGPTFATTATPSTNDTAALLTPELLAREHNCRIGICEVCAACLLCAALLGLALWARSTLRFMQQGVTAMTSQTQSAPSRESAASRRDFVTAVTAVAAVSATATTVSAQAQAGMNLQHSNPPGMTQPAAYSHVVEVNGPHRLVFVAGQTGVDANGKVVQGFRAQAVQAFENIKTALASVGGTMDNVVRLTTYMTDLEQNAGAYREVRASFFTNKGALPASTLLQITRLANPSFLVEVEATAILPPRA